MNRARLNPRTALAMAAVTLVVFGGLAGYGLAQLKAPSSNGAAGSEDARRVLYWYDPMVPSQRFDRPGKSPFMDMQLVPKYADEPGSGAGVRIDPAQVQNLGVRTAEARRAVLTDGITVTGTVAYNERDLAIVQARAAGFVQRVYGRAPGDVVRAGAPLADVLVPEWAGAQSEFLAARRSGDAALAGAARQRLTLLGMPSGVIAAVERSGRPQTVHTVTTPVGGVIRTLGVRAGMTVSEGQTLAEVSGLSTVWLNAAVPEALASRIRVGDAVTASLPAFPGQAFSGRVSAVLPEAQGESRTLTARIELGNRGGVLRPGMFAAVEFGGAGRPALVIPSEAVIRTGHRALVMLALAGGRFQPAEVRIGREVGGQTEILAGLAEGERIVASGQFLIDSEASLSGVTARPVASERAAASPTPSVLESRARIEKLEPRSVTLSHDPIPAAGWPAMTMAFRLENPGLARGLKIGDRVRFSFVQQREGPTIVSLRKEAGR